TLQDFSQAVFKIKGLINMIAQNDPSILEARMEAVDMARSVARAILVDADGEGFSIVERQLSGVPNVVNHVWLRLAAAARRPVALLMGQSPPGLATTGSMEIRSWYDQIQTYRETELEPVILYLLELVTGQGGWVIEWPSLWQMTPMEQADHRLKVAQAD